MEVFGAGQRLRRCRIMTVVVVVVVVVITALLNAVPIANAMGGQRSSTASTSSSSLLSSLSSWEGEEEDCTRRQQRCHPPCTTMTTRTNTTTTKSCRPIASIKSVGVDGTSPENHDHDASTIIAIGVSHRYHRRADTVAIGGSHQTIVEGIRPMVKGKIAQDAFVNNMHWECDMMREYPLGLRILRCVGRACGIEGCCALRGLSLCAWYRSMDPPSHHRHRRLHRHHRHRGNNVNDILAVTDGVVEAVRDVGRYASATFAGARSMLAECGMRRLEAEGESVQRERTFLKTTATSMRTMTTSRISSTPMARAQTIRPSHRTTITAAHSMAMTMNSILNL